MKCNRIAPSCISPSLLLLTALVLFGGCTPDKGGSLGQKATASFTMSPVAGRANTYLLTSTSKNAIAYQWFKGSGDYVIGQAVDTAYFPTKGVYKVELRAFGRGGYDTAVQSVTIAADDLLNIPSFKLLIANSWKLDASDPAPIIVGTEGNPAQYFGGGALADCQKDDFYTFKADLTLTYNSAGATFNAGNIAPNYSCGTDRSYTNYAFTFAPSVPAGAAGIASITLSGAVPAHFIGVTDVSSNNYRIISISPGAMVLRSGTTSETVHQFKFIAK